MNRPIRRVAVSGASGLVGSVLAKSLTKAGYEVLRMARPGRSGAEHGGSSELIWNPESGIIGLTDVEPVDAFVHLAGRSIASGRWTAAEKKLIRSSRVESTHVLATQLANLDSPPKVFVSASAVGIYGECGSNTVSESHPIDSSNDFLAEVARDWEEATGPLDSVAATRVVKPRLGIVMTPDGGALGKVLPLFRNFLGGRLGSGQQYWSWVSMHDCVQSLQWMLETDSASGPYNVVAPNPITNLEFTQQLARAVGRPVSLPVPEFALRLAMGEMADALLLRSCRAIPARLLQSGFSFYNSDFDEFLAREFQS